MTRINKCYKVNKHGHQFSRCIKYRLNVDFSGTYLIFLRISSSVSEWDTKRFEILWVLSLWQRKDLVWRTVSTGRCGSWVLSEAWRLVMNDAIYTTGDWDFINLKPGMRHYSEWVSEWLLLLNANTFFSYIMARTS